MSKRSIDAEVVRSVAFGSITNSYANLGSSLTNSLVMMSLTNTTDKTLFVSENGTDDHYELPAGASPSLDFQANAREGDILVKAIGTQFSIRGVTGDLPTSGKIILEGQSV